MKNHFCTASFAFPVFIRRLFTESSSLKSRRGFCRPGRRFAIYVPPALLRQFISFLQALYASESAEHTSLSDQAHSRSSTPSPEPELPLYPLPQ